MLFVPCALRGSLDPRPCSGFPLQCSWDGCQHSCSVLSSALQCLRLRAVGSTACRRHASVKDLAGRRAVQCHALRVGRAGHQQPVWYACAAYIWWHKEKCLSPCLSRAVDIPWQLPGSMQAGMQAVRHAQMQGPQSQAQSPSSDMSYNIKHLKGNRLNSS